MKQNIIAHIALCGLLTVANITLAMDDTINKALVLYPNNPTQALLNGYYTNSISSNLPIHQYLSEHGLSKDTDAAEITYTNTKTNTTKNVRFSGKNNVNELLKYDNEKYHVIIDSEGDDLFAIQMNQTPTPTSSSSSSTPISPQLSPRNKQIISEVLGGEKQIIHELISDDNRGTYKQPSPTCDTITGFFTKDLSSNIPEIPVYDYVHHQKVDNTHAQFTYKENNTVKTITLEFQNEHDDEKFLFVQENVMGLIKQYVINLHPEEVSIDSNSENGNSSTNSDETSLQDSEPKQQLQGSFIPEILNNMDYYEGVKITQTHELHIKGFTTENFTLHPSDNYQYQIEYKDKTGNICTSIFNCSQQLQTTSAYIITETDPILAIKLPTQEAKNTQLTSSDETSLEQTTKTNNNNNNNNETDNDSPNLPTAGNLTIAQTALSHFCTMYNDYMPEGNYPEYNGEITESTEHSSKVTFIDNNNVQREVWVPGTPENATHVFIKNSMNKILCAIKLATQKIQETPTQRVRGYLTSNSYDLSNITSIKQYQGEITKTEDLSVEITYTDETGKKQTIWAENTNTPSTPTNAIFENNQKIAQFIIKLPTQESKYVNLDDEVESQFINSDISKKSTSQRFNKNPNERDPRYTYIGAAFLTLCIALAYKYNKLPDIFTQILDQCFAQLHNLTPSRFSR